MLFAIMNLSHSMQVPLPLWSMRILKKNRDSVTLVLKFLESNLLDAKMLVKMDILVGPWWEYFYKYKYMIK
jgi:hypothetical protein